MNLFFKCSISGALALALAAGAMAGEPTSGKINYRATATYSDGTSADRLYSITVGDVDGDGVSDEGWLRVACSDGTAVASHYYSVKSPRDSASGMASGKRMHKPFKITMELDRKGGVVGRSVSWDLKEAKGAKLAADGSAKTSYDVKKVEGSGARSALDGKTMGHDDWHEAAIREGSPNLCA